MILLIRLHPITGPNYAYDGRLDRFHLIDKTDKKALEIMLSLDWGVIKDSSVTSVSMAYYLFCNERELKKDVEIYYDIEEIKEWLNDVS